MQISTIHLDWSVIAPEIGAAVFLGIVAIVLLLWKKVTTKAAAWVIKIFTQVFITPPPVFDPSESLRHKRVQEILQRLRDNFNARRVVLFQFHNGDVYLLGSHTWKATCTYEVAERGIAYVASQNTGLPASNIVDIVEPIMSGLSRDAAGVTVLETCPSENRLCKLPLKRHCVIHHEIAQMNMCLFRFLCEEQGVGHVISVNLVHGEKRTAVGYISLQFATLSEEQLQDILQRVCLVCTAAEQAQFLLQDNEGKIPEPSCS